MKAKWLKPVLPLGLLCLASAVGCDEQKDPSAEFELSSNAALVQCALPVLSAATERGAGRPAMGGPMTLPVPASIPVSGGAANATATLDYTLPADGNRPLSCRYKRAGAELKLVNCDRDVDATSWLEASSVNLTVSDPNARASLTICPIGPITDPALTLPPVAELSIRGDQIPNGRAVGWDEIPGALTTQDIETYVATARANERVKGFLGERSAFTQYLDDSADKVANRTTHKLKLIFYSHSNSRAVEVTMNRNNVTKVQNVEYYPPEGKEEIDQAVQLAKQDARLAGKVADLTGGGMAFQHVENTAYLNHRVMDIRFYDAALVARFYAVVDLTDLKVQAAGEAQ